MSRFVLALLTLLSGFMAATARNINADRLPLSEVLKQIDRSSDSVAVSFVYDELEDYPVTATISTDDVVRAVFQAVGLYPVKVSVLAGGKIITVEPRIRAGIKVSGRIVDEGGHPIEYASVKFYSMADSAFLSSAVTNSVGDFVVPLTLPVARMTVTAMGYMPLTQTVGPENQGNIHLVSNPIELKAVTVESKIITSEGGKLTARHTLTQLRHSFDIYTLLGQMPLPGLYVDPVMRTISAYSENPVILVNGVERESNTLLSVRPANVSRIEYITDIPAKYMSRRPPVVINIILKEPQDGGSAWVSAQSAVNTGFVDANGGVSYNQGKSEFTASYRYSYRDYNERVTDQSTSYIAPDSRVDIDGKGRKSPFDYNTNNGQIGYTYRDSETAFLVTKVNFGNLVRHSGQNAEVTDTYRGDYIRHSHTRDANFSVQPDIYFQKDWGRNGLLEVQAVGNITDMDYTRNLIDTIGGVAVASYPSDLRTSVRSLKFEANIDRTMGRFYAYVGYRYNYSRTKNNYLLDNYVQYMRSSSNDIYGHVSTTLADTYMSLNSTLGLIAYPGSEKYPQISKPALTASLYLSRRLSSAVELRLSSEYWTDRPSLSQLTDYRQRFDGYLLSTGNPYLRNPKSYSVTPTLRWSNDRIWTELNLSWSESIRPLYTTVDYLGNGEFMTRPVNGDRSSSFIPRLNVGVNQVFNGHFSAQFTYQYRHKRYVCPDGIYTLNAPDWNLILTGYLGPWQCQFAVSHPGRNMNGPEVWRAENNNSFRISRRFGKHWNTFATIMYFLKNEGTVYPSGEKLLHRVTHAVTNIRDNHAMVVVGVSYSGSFGRIFRVGQRSLTGGSGTGDYKVVESTGL